MDGLLWKRRGLRRLDGLLRGLELRRELRLRRKRREGSRQRRLLAGGKIAGLAVLRVRVTGHGLHASSGWPRGRVSARWASTHCLDS